MDRKEDMLRPIGEKMDEAQQRLETVLADIDKTLETGQVQGSVTDILKKTRRRTQYDLDKMIRQNISNKYHVWEIWSEGYRASGDSGGATLMGRMPGISFKDACDRLARLSTDFAECYDPERMTFWACKLYPTHEEAAKSFG